MHVANSWCAIGFFCLFTFRGLACEKYDTTEKNIVLSFREIMAEQTALKEKSNCKDQKHCENDDCIITNATVIGVSFGERRWYYDASYLYCEVQDLFAIASVVSQKKYDYFIWSSSTIETFYIGTYSANRIQDVAHQYLEQTKKYYCPEQDDF